MWEHELRLESGVPGRLKLGRPLTQMTFQGFPGLAGEKNCRKACEHARGCWALDGIPKKE